MTSWPEYVRWFHENYDSIAPDLLVDGAVECNGGASLAPLDLHYPRSAPWRVDWAVVFQDGKYFRVKESFKRLQRPNLGMGEREHFSFHYGSRHAEYDSRGFPKTAPRDNPPHADLRIDLDKNLNAHIHAGSPEHIYQRRVNGFVIQDADMFQFLRAVRDHRSTKQSLIDLLHIKVLD